MQCYSVDGKDGRVEPVSNRICAKIDVVVRCRWTMNDNRPPETIAVLDRIVRVIPLQ